MQTINGMKRYRREVILIGYEARIIHVDRADNTDITTIIEYYEAEDITRVYKHFLKTRLVPTWHDNLDEENDLINPQLERLDEMTDDQVRDFFDKCYGSEYQNNDDDYNDKYYVTISEYEPPHFKLV